MRLWKSRALELLIEAKRPFAPRNEWVADRQEGGFLAGPVGADSGPRIPVTDTAIVVPSVNERPAGESRAGRRSGVHSIRPVLSLRMGRMSRFAAVGALGTIVNLLVMYGLVQVRVNYVAAAVVAAEFSILHNFLLHERFVFRDLRGGRNRWVRRLAEYLAFNNAEALVRLPFLILLVETVHLWPLLAQALTLAVAFVARFVFVSRVVYRSSPIGRRTVVLRHAGVPQQRSSRVRVVP